MPYDLVAIPMPPGVGERVSMRLGWMHFACWNEKPILVHVQAPGSSLQLLLQVEGATHSAFVEEQLNRMQEQFVAFHLDQPEARLAAACRATLDRLVALTREGANEEPFPELDEWAASWDSPGERETRTNVARLPGGWTACSRQVGHARMPSTVSYMPASGGWLLHLFTEAGWPVQYGVHLMNAVFGPPSRLMLLPFVAAYLKEIESRQPRCEAQLVALEAPRGPRVESLSPEVDPMSVHWALQVREVGGEGGGFDESLEALYHGYLDRGIEPRAHVAAMFEALDRHRGWKNAEDAKVPVEMDVNRLYPVLRRRAELEPALEDEAPPPLYFPLAGELGVALGIQCGSEEWHGWHLVHEGMYGSVHSSASLLHAALVNVAQEVAARPLPWPIERVGEGVWAIDFPPETGTFLLTRAGIDWLDRHCSEEDWLAAPYSGFYLLLRRGVPPFDLRLLCPNRPATLSEVPVRWGDLRQAVLRLLECGPVEPGS